MLKSAFISLISLLAIIFISDAGWAQSNRSAFYYFNPDSSQSNLSRLKRDMDDFFSKAGFQINFQPFTHLIDLENQVKKKPPAFLFVPKWYLNKYGTRLQLRHMLTASRKGKTSYNKILVGNKQTDLMLKNTPYLTVAMTSMGPNGDTILYNTISTSNKNVADKINPIIVTKDSDALFALALGQVDMAFVVKENLNLIANINPNILQSVRPLLESEPIPMPVLCFMEGVASDSDVKKLKTLFLKGKNRKKFFDIMEMLQINDWQAVNK